MLRIPEQARTLCRVSPLVFAAPLGCHLKLESMQRTGSFNLRGAAVKLARMSPLDRAAGVVTASPGNHGMALACVGRTLGVSVRVVVPDTAPRVKREGISSFGGEMVRHGIGRDEAERMGRRLAALRDSLYISPSEDTDVIEGNGGWIARELFEQLREVRRVVVPMGDGGLAAGIINELAGEGVEVIGAQPLTQPAMAESLNSHRALTEFRGQPTLCEELEGGVGWRSFRIIERQCHHHSVTMVSEAEILAAVVFAYRVLGLVIEPSAAVVIAAATSGRIPIDRHTALIITAGNIDNERLARILEGGEPWREKSAAPLTG